MKQININIIINCIQNWEIYQNAQQYYQYSIDNAPTANPKTFIKLGNLYQYHLNDHPQAQSMYDKCIELNPKEDQCLFNYANLMAQQNNDQSHEINSEYASKTPLTKL